jgi:hypothetical protein
LNQRFKEEQAEFKKKLEVLDFEQEELNEIKKKLKV